MKEQFIKKKIICLYTNDLYQHKEIFKNTLFRSDNRYIDFEYSDWEYIVAPSTSIENLQEKIDSELIDKADIVVAIVGKYIEKKYLKQEIQRVFTLQIENKENIDKVHPLFFINFVPFVVESDKDNDVDNLIEIYTYKKELQEELKEHNDDILFFDKKDLSLIAHHILDNLSIWYKDEIEHYKKNKQENQEQVQKVLNILNNEAGDNVLEKIKDILEEKK